jgi:23S rRNA (guanosine2251-2'-O)-methyltransferase
MSEPQFQIYECQNPTCRLRIPSDLTVTEMQICPLCGETLQPIGTPFNNDNYQSSDHNTSNCTIEVLLDNLRSALNVGSIFRTADGAGISHIYCCGTTPTPDHSKIKKTSLGAQDFVPWSYHRNSLDVLQPKLAENFEICSLEATKKSINLLAPDRRINNQSILLIVGNEISGIDPELIKNSHHVFTLPMMGRKRSLNVAVAAGIALYALRFQVINSLFIDY